MSFSRFDFLGGPQIISERPATAKERAAAGNAAEGGAVEYKHSVKPLQLLWSKFPNEFGPRYASAQRISCVSFPTRAKTYARLL
jgi:hypothetical protein